MISNTFDLHKGVSATTVRSKQERTKQVYAYFDVFISTHPDSPIGTVGLKTSGKHIVNNNARPVFNTLDVAVKYLAFEFLAKKYLDSLSSVV